MQLKRANISWATRITSLTNEGQSRKAILLFHQLQKSVPGVGITEFILSAVLGACRKLESLKEGKQAHCVILKHGFHGDVVLMTSLLDMYSKCYGIEEARRIFYEMPNRDVIATNCLIAALFRSRLIRDAIQLFESMTERDVGSWNSLISGLEENWERGKALFFFRRMRCEGTRPDLLTMASTLSVCAHLAGQVHGKQVHVLVIKCGFELYQSIGNATVDMYAKVGCIDDALVCFNNMSCKNVISWTSLIVAYGKHGRALDAIEAFHRMKMEGIAPNEVTFLGVLFACSHAGLIQEGWKIFNTMIQTYSVTPVMEHYTCMVDLLGRAGHIEDALQLIESMPMKPDAELLTAFLSSCCTNVVNLEIARRVGQRLLELEPQEAGAYMVLSNFYGQVGDSEGMSKVRRLMLNRGVRKVKAYTWIEINRSFHVFESGDKSHPLSRKIYDYLQDLIEKLKSNGYVAKTRLVMQNVDELTKEEILLGHSEKLAIGLGLISTPPKTPLTIVKNLSVCADCHEVTCLISKVEGREIVARDSSRFHRFKDGVCSCGNYW